MTYDDVAVAQSSISWFDGKDFNGHTIKVQRSNINKHLSGKMSFSKNFTLDSGNGLRNCYFGKIELSSFEIDGNVDFTISIYHVEKMHVDMKIPSSRLTPNVVSKNGKVEDDDGEVCCKMKTTLEMGPWVQLAGMCNLSMHTIHNSFEATITVTFEPMAPKKEEYYIYYDILQLSKLQKHRDQDFQIISKDGKKFGFSKSLLMNISPVFRAMIENPLIEFNTRRANLSDTDSKTVFGLYLILSGNMIPNHFLTIGFLEFCHMYEIHQLYKICSEYLVKTLTREKLLDTVKVAWLFQDENLLCKCVEIIGKNYGSFEENQEWKIFVRNHPDFLVDVMKKMLFAKK